MGREDLGRPHTQTLLVVEVEGGVDLPFACLSVCLSALGPQWEAQDSCNAGCRVCGGGGVLCGGIVGNVFFLSLSSKHVIW